MSYRDLKSFQSATIIYDFTVEFVKRYVDFKSRTKDQMEQAARSGKQNIVEGSTERTSSKNELKLLGVSRASFEELLNDYEDFLRQKGLKKWDMHDPQAKAIRNLPYGADWSYASYASFLSDAETAGNAMLCLIHQCNYLLDRQIKVLDEKFVKEGGWDEGLRKRRDEERKRQSGGPASWVRG